VVSEGRQGRLVKKRFVALILVEFVGGRIVGGVVVVVAVAVAVHFAAAAFVGGGLVTAAAAAAAAVEFMMEDGLELARRVGCRRRLVLLGFRVLGGEVPGSLN